MNNYLFFISKILLPVQKAPFVVVANKAVKASV